MGPKIEGVKKRTKKGGSDNGMRKAMNSSGWCFEGGATFFTYVSCNFSTRN